MYSLLRGVLRNRERGVNMLLMIRRSSNLRIFSLISNLLEGQPFRHPTDLHMDQSKNFTTKIKIILQANMLKFTYNRIAYNLFRKFTKIKAGQISQAIYGRGCQLKSIFCEQVYIRFCIVSMDLLNSIRYKYVAFYCS